MSRRRTPSRTFSPLDGLSPSALSERAGTPDPRKATRRTNGGITLTTLRARMHPDDKRRVEAFCIRLSESLRTTVRPSTLLRGLLEVVRETEADILGEARRSAVPEQPRTDDQRSVAEFERAIAAVLREGIRRSTR